MTLSELNEKLTRLTGENTNRYTNAQRAVDLTVAQDKVVSMILDSQDDSDYDDPNHGDFNILTAPTVANQRDYTFSQTEGVLQFKEVEVSWDGTTYYKATKLDASINPYPMGNETLLDNNFSRETPAYDVEGLSVLIYPRPTDGNGYIRVRVSRESTPITSSDLSTGTKVIGIDRAYHYLVLLLVVHQRYIENNITGIKLDRVKKEIEDYEIRLRRQYGRKQVDGNINLNSTYDLTDFY